MGIWSEVILSDYEAFLASNPKETKKVRAIKRLCETRRKISSNYTCYDGDIIHILRQPARWKIDWIENIADRVQAILSAN